MIVILLLSVIFGRLSNVTNFEFCGGFVNISSAIVRELVHVSTLDFSRESKCNSKFEVLGDEKLFLTWIENRRLVEFGRLSSICQQYVTLIEGPMIVTTSPTYYLLNLERRVTINNIPQRSQQIQTRRPNKLPHRYQYDL